MEKFARKLGKPALKIPVRAMQNLEAYGWPGNVRELKHTVERSLVTARGDHIEFDLPDSPSPVTREFRSLEEVERDYIREVLKARNWKIQGKNSAAQVLKMHPNTLRARMAKLGISKPR